MQQNKDVIAITFTYANFCNPWIIQIDRQLYQFTEDNTSNKLQDKFLSYLLWYARLQL